MIDRKCDMPLFPVTLPSASSGRGSLPRNLARNIGPLFGVPSDDAPHGRSWVCDYDRITLKEIGRGAPLAPPRAPDWHRGIPDPLRIPGLTSTALNRFGPDTKAATILAATNVLHREFADDLRACLDLSARQACDPVVLLAMWAAGVLTAYRSYPLLVVNAIKARAVQRAVSTEWDVTVAPRIAAAPIEYGGEARVPDVGTEFSPTRYVLLDDTLTPLVKLLFPHGSEEADAQQPVPFEVEQVVDNVASAMARVIARIGNGREGDPAITWVVEPRPDHREIDTFLPPLRVVKNFIEGQATARVPSPKEEIVPAAFVPRLPTSAEWNDLDGRRVRLLVEMHTVALRWMRESDVVGEETPVGQLAAERLRELAAIARDLLPADDPIRLDTVVAAATAATRAAVRDDGDPALAVICDALDVLIDGLSEGSISPGFGLEILSRGAVTLNRVRRSAARKVDLDFVHLKLGEYWGVFDRVLFAVAIPPAGPSAAGYHLHNYAGYLGTLDDDPDALARAVDYFKRYVIPSRTVAARHVRVTNTLRLSLQVAARAAAALGRLRLAASELDAATECLTDALRWSNAALATSSGRQLLDDSSATPREANFHLASAVLPTAALAARLGVPLPSETLQGMRDAADRARVWVDAAPGKRVEQDERLRELEAALTEAREA